MNHIELQLISIGDHFQKHIAVLGFVGSYGVTLFFLLSGFLMVKVSEDKSSGLGYAGKFARDRLARIVPLYWLLTAIQILWLFFAARRGDLPAAQLVEPAHIIKAFFFVPFSTVYAVHRPPIGQGWTLDFEMFFYLIFTVAIAIGRSHGWIFAIVLILAFLGAGSFIDLPEPIALLAKPILCSFVAGMLIAKATRFVPSIKFGESGLFIIASVAAASVALSFLAGESLPLQLLVGAPVLAIAVTVHHDAPRSKLLRALVEIGNWSYSTYLLHGFIILGVSIIWRKFFGADYLVGYVIIVLVITYFASYALHYSLEKPATKFFKSNWKWQTA
jgi:exopolysaccharide production protein ExoZ